MPSAHKVASTHPDLAAVAKCPRPWPGGTASSPAGRETLIAQGTPCRVLGTHNHSLSLPGRLVLPTQVVMVGFIAQY